MQAGASQGSGSMQSRAVCAGRWMGSEAVGKGGIHAQLHCEVEQPPIKPAFWRSHAHHQASVRRKPLAADRNFAHLCPSM